MRTALALFVALTSSTLAQWLVLKPTEFEPLTSLPWEEKAATPEKILGAIFREPNAGIRYRILCEYLWQIDVKDMSHVFDLCVPLESTQHPDELVKLFIEVWAERDPLRCWEWVKHLFQITGIDDGVLGYDSWNNSRLTARNLDAIRASTFWIESRALEAFPILLSQSELPKAERVRIMEEFAKMWFEASSWWPTNSFSGYETSKYTWHPSNERGILLGAFKEKITLEKVTERLKWFDPSQPVVNLASEIACRRMLQARPQTALEIMKAIRERKATGLGGDPNEPSAELLLLWAKIDLPGITRWAQSLDTRDKDLARRTKGLLMSFTDEATRKRWLEEAKTADPKEEEEDSLLYFWAQWDPKGAMDATANAGNIEACRSMANAATYGPGLSQPWNQSRYAFQVLSTYDFSKMTPSVHDAVLNDCYMVMEQWDDMDVASAARFGYAYLLRTKYVPHEGLIQFFSGKDIYGREDGMIDRTFCALRVWAVVRPDEMKNWIATIQDAEMRKALTWLLENPWGTGSDE